MGMIDLISKKEAILSVVKRNNGIDIKVFGSTVLGDANQESDVDFLVELNKNASLLDLVEIKIELEELLGHAVDVVSKNGLKNNEIGNHIRTSAIAI